MVKASTARANPEYREPELVQSEEMFEVMVDPDQTMGELLERGNFIYWDPKVMRFERMICLGHRGPCQLKTCYFTGVVDSKSAYRLIRAAGLEPASLSELLAVAAYFPDEDREESLVAMGSNEWRDSGGEWTIFTLCFGDRHEDFVHIDFTEGKTRLLCMSGMGSIINSGEQILVKVT